MSLELHGYDAFVMNTCARPLLLQGAPERPSSTYSCTVDTDLVEGMSP